MQPTEKATLRKQLRAGRRDLPASQQADAARGLLEQLQQLPVFIDSEKVAIYLANDGEISPIQVMKWLQSSGRKPLLPVIRQTEGKNSLMFAEVNPETEFENNRYGIAEPVVAEAELLSPTQLDLVLLPLVGFDEQGNRIGMGGGFYDTTFEFVATSKVPVKPVMIGLAHECQKVPEIAAEHWDIPLSVVVTDQQIYRLSV